MITMPMLPMLASCVGTTRVVRVKRSWLESLIIWAGLVAESGTKKTPSQQAVMAAIRRIQRRRYDEHAEAMQLHEQELAQYEQELAQWKKRPKLKDGDAPTQPDAPACMRHIVSDSTTEALAPILQQNPRGVLLARDELAGWIGDMDRYSGTKGGDAPRWLSIWSADPITIDRKTSGTTYIHRPSVSITGGIQPAILRSALGIEHREDGMAARFLLAMPPDMPDVWSDDDIPESVEAELSHIVEALMGLKHELDDDGHPCPVEVRLDGDARLRFIQWHDDHGERMAATSGDLRAVMAKMKGYTLRLALLVHLVKWASGESVGEDIDVESIESAISLIEWHIHEARRIYAMLDESDDDRELRRLAEVVRRLADPDNGITANELRRASRQFSKTEDAERVLGLLAKAGYGQWKVQDTGGRPRDAFHLAQAVYVTTSAKNTGKNDLKGDTAGVFAEAGV
ncbi:MAG: YfjI family protein [Phycisphaeraceae bacterium]